MAEGSDAIWGSLVLQVILIILNAFFAGTEIAVLTLDENQLRRRAEGGDAKSKHMLRMIQNPSQFLSTIQIGITLAGFLGSAFAASNLAAPLARLLERIGITFLPYRTLETVCVIIVTLLLSYFTLVFGELVPKRVAMRYAEQFARFASGILRVLEIVMKPFVWFLTKSTNAVLRLFHIDSERADQEVTEETIRMMVEAGALKGTIQKSKAEIIDNMLELNRHTAEALMVHRTDVAALSITDTRAEILQEIRETGYSRFPVYDEDIDDIVGTLNAREYLLNGLDEEAKPLRELIRPAYFAPETVRADVLFYDMQRNKNHMAIVVDEYGGTSGIVTMEDLIEEVFGDIYDEFDEQEEQEIVQLEPNLWRVSGGIDLETLSEALDIALPLDGEFDTLGGLVYSCMTTIPQDGATPVVQVDNLRIQVEKIEDRRVESALVSKEIPQIRKADEEA